MPIAKPSDMIQSASRALRIIDELGARPKGLTARNIARRCELPLATTYHLLRTLCYERYVEHHPNELYVLGPKIVSRFRDFLASVERPANIDNVLRHLSALTRQSVYYSQLVGDQVAVTAVAEGRYSPHLEELMVRFSDGAHATALGKALLWSLPPTARRGYLAEHGMRPFTSMTVHDPDALDRELHALARQPAFIEHEQYRTEVCCGAVLVRGARAGTIGMSCGLDRWRQMGSRLTRELRLAAKDLETTPAGPIKDHEPI